MKTSSQPSQAKSPTAAKRAATSVGYSKSASCGWPPGSGLKWVHAPLGPTCLSYRMTQKYPRPPGGVGSSAATASSTCPSPSKSPATKHAAWYGEALQSTSAPSGLPTMEPDGRCPQSFLLLSYFITQRSLPSDV